MTLLYRILILKVMGRLLHRKFKKKFLAFGISIACNLQSVSLLPVCKGSGWLCVFREGPSEELQNSTVKSGEYHCN